MYRYLLRYFGILFIILHTCWNAQAQPQNITWCYAIDSLKSEEVISTVFDKEGNIYVAINYQRRKYEGAWKSVIGRRKNYQSLLLKFDTLGQLLWQQNIRSNLDVRMTALAIAPNGDVLVTGTGDGQIDFSGTLLDIPFHLSDVHYGGLFIARLDKKGAYQWVQSWESELWATALTIAVSQKDDIYLGYLHKGNLKNKGQLVEKYIEQRNPFRQLVLAKLDNKGVKIESHVLSQDRSGYDNLLTIKFDKNNNMILYGRYENNLSLLYTEPIHNDNRMIGLNSYIAKYGQNDSLLWMKEIGGIHEQFINDIAIAPDQSIYITGVYNRECILTDRRIAYSNSMYDKDSEIKFGSNYFFYHLLSDGSIDFAKYKYHTTLSSFIFRPKAIAVDGQARVHQVGLYSGKVEIEGKQLESSWYQTQPFYALWQEGQLLELNELSDAPFGQFTADNFNINDHHFVGSACYDYKDTYINIDGQKVFLPEPNGWPVSFIYGGSFSARINNTIVSDLDSSVTTSFNQVMVQDTFMNLTPLVNNTFSEDSTSTWSTEFDVILFPNPASKQVNLQFNKKLDAIRLGVFSNLGQLLFVQQLNSIAKNSILSLDINQLPAGIYYLKVSDNAQQKVFPFVKQ